MSKNNDMLGPLTRALVGVPAKMLGLILDIANRLRSTDGENFFNDLAKFVREWRKQVVEKVNTFTFLRKLFTTDLGATDGTETFQSSGLFAGEIEGLAVPAVAQGKATPAIKTTVWEMKLNGIFILLFGSLGKNRSRWTEAQVVRFCRDHRDKLRVGGYGTFFEMEGGVVADVCFGYDDYLHVFIHSFSFDRIWDASYHPRLVSLQ